MPINQLLDAHAASISGYDVDKLIRGLLKAARPTDATWSLDEQVRLVLNALREVLPYDSGGLYWIDHAARRLRPAATVGAEWLSADLKRWDIPLGQGIMSAIVESGLGELANNAHLDPRSVYPPDATVSCEHLVAVPVAVEGRSVGVFYVARRQDPPFSPQDFAVVQLFIGHAAAAIQKAHLFEQTLESEARYRTLFEESIDAVFISRPDGELIDMNPAGLALFGLRDTTELLHRRADDLYADPADRARLRRGIEQDGYVKDLEVVMRRTQGEELHLLVTARAVRDADGSIVAYRGMLRDVTERKRWEQVLRHQALHDPLTELPNRTLLHDRLQQAIAAAGRQGESVSLLLLDLDRFKEVNDTLGHQAGDRLLQHVAQRLQTAVRGSDTVARLGGDEFAILLPGADSVAASRAAAKLLSALEQPVVLDGRELPVGSSIGIAAFPEHGADADTLLRRADIAMYAAKRAHRGLASYSVDQELHSAARLALVGSLRRAILSDELTLHYQPQVETRQRRLTGVEALVRWWHPERGLIGPDQFVPLAEQSGLIRLMTRWVLRAALAQSCAWRSMALEPCVSINLSSHDLLDPHLPEYVAGQLAQWCFPAERLTLEITESALLAEPDRALDVLGRVRGLGVRVALDDFGTGYSSLAYLKQWPVDELKVDRTFVRTMVSLHRDRAIVRAIVDLAHTLGLAVVAEGVEDPATLDLLDELGCDRIQGDHIAPALPSIQLLRWWQQRRTWPNLRHAA